MENAKWPVVDAPDAEKNCENGLSGQSILASPDSSAATAMLRLAQAMEAQNVALWALVNQTAAMMEMILNSAEDAAAEEESEEQTTYLDGTPIDRTN